MVTRPHSSPWTTLLGIGVFLCGESALAASDELGSMSLAQLMNEPVTSVSKKETKFSDSAAAISVITPDDLRRLGITSLPDALRLVPGMDVARISSDEWAVSSRGFNGQLANKLLVLIDGRTVYSPSSAGVFWNAQDLMLEDIERIEVIRGPGATLFGSNAVNGVINITTKKAQDTEGVLLSFLSDSEPASQWAARYGGHIGSDLYFRAYAKYLDQGGLADATHTFDTGAWHTLRDGFRADWDTSGNDVVTVQGDSYAGRAFAEITTPTLRSGTNYPELYSENNSGGNLLGRLTHHFTINAVTTIQGYIDHAVQDDGSSVEHLTTYDLNVQHQFKWGSHDIVLGTGYRNSQVDEVSHSFELMWNPANQDLRLINVFVQDDVTLLPNRLRATLGVKYEGSSLVSDSVEPNVRLMWTPLDHHAVWAAVSRATRTPSLYELASRLNASASQPAPDAPPVLLSVFPNTALRSEQVLAYEIGYRYTPAKRISIDISGYLNNYTRIVALSPVTTGFETDPAPPHVLLSVTQVSGGGVKTYGAEATLRWQALDQLLISARYDWTHIDAQDNPGAAEGTPTQQAQLRAYFDLTRDVEINSAFYYVDSVTAPVGLTSVPISAYVRADLGVVWHANASLSFGLWGVNLLQRDHIEFASLNPSPLTEIPRSVLGKITWSF